MKTGAKNKTAEARTNKKLDIITTWGLLFAPREGNTITTAPLVLSLNTVSTAVCSLHITNPSSQEKRIEATFFVFFNLKINLAGQMTLDELRLQKL